MRFCPNRSIASLATTIAPLLLTFTVLGGPVLAQGLGLPDSGVAPSAAAASAASRPQNAGTPPSLQNQPAAAPSRPTPLPGGGQAGGGGNLPQTAGQEHRVYDLRPYTGYLTNHDRPEQAIVDWVLRETGTDVWFTSPFGFLNADRDQLSVYHTREMHEVVSGIVDRFVAGEKDPQVLSLKVMTVGNPNWRSRAHLLMQHVNVDSPGVQAWLLSKENAALVLNLLRQRTDTRQVQALDLITYNGQTEKLASTRGRNYVQNVKPAATGWPPYEPETGEIQEGYRLEISPLLSVDGSAIDCVIKASIDQVDQLKPVELDLPLPNAQVHRTKIDVPQVVSWRLHERFRWPSDMVLLLSCGVIASPERPQAALPLLNLEMLTGTTAGRADALMFIEFRGRASENLTTTPLVPQISAGYGAPNRGRY
ncbi:hypothetical protein Mal15_08020 [Stieleria maiorica]|uniref:Uncharacterized protein n=1 Tax=Stieleria maiorica TaxID=2795974 RepID=A0A5B9M6P3_9BACT|nr:hypothetical protein [Stieleria maiorica]QEF96772.1 hypothetical protein Mal15_08020 [Stieleria maiorica]